MTTNLKFIAVALFLILGAAALFSVPQIAVLDAILAPGMDPAVAVPVTDKIIEELVKSGKYRVLDRANVEQILEEKEFQLSSGIVRNEEVRQAGEYLGADFVVVANVSRVGQTFVVAAKMIDVVSGEIAAQTSYERQGRIDVLLDIARVVGGRLAGTELVLIEVEEPEVEEEPAKEEVAEAPKVEPVVKPPREIKPVEFKRFVVGVKGGGNLANIIWDDFYIWGVVPDYVSGEEPASTFRFTAGAFFALYFNSYFSVQTELNYSQKGYSIYSDDLWYAFPFGYVTTTWKFNYVEIPVLIKVGFPRRVSVYAVAGGSISIFVGGTATNEYDDQITQTDFDSFNENPADVEDLLSASGISVNSLDAGILFGAGVDFILKSFVINIEARYTFGLLNVTTDDIFSNSVFSFTGGVGYRF